VTLARGQQRGGSQEQTARWCDPASPPTSHLPPSTTRVPPQVLALPAAILLAPHPKQPPSSRHSTHSPCTSKTPLLPCTPHRIESETEALLQSENTRRDEFSPEVLACLPPLPWSVTAADLAVRKDLRRWRIVSIDPPTARDLDDAVSVQVGGPAAGVPS
jgi:hypothetical protein